MGIKRGAFESVGLTQTADSAKNPNVQIDSVARGMRAFGAGLGAVADFCGKMADMANKAYSARTANLESASKSLESLADAEANLTMTQDAFKGKESSPEAKLAIENAKKVYQKAQEDSDLAIDRYARTGLFYKQLGTPTAASGAKRCEDAEKVVAKRLADGEDPKKVGGVLSNVEHQSFFGAVFGN
jgi:hypothetical protein